MPNKKSEESLITTDVANELAITLRKIKNFANSSSTLESKLADLFRTEVWSTEYYQTLFCLLDRCDEVAILSGTLDIDEEMQKITQSHISKIKQAFTSETMRQRSDSTFQHRLLDENISSIQMLSFALRKDHGYIKITPDIREDLINDINALLKWLEEKQLSEADFVRQALIDGLYTVRFKLDRFEWFGRLYCIKSMKEVISAYLILEGMTPEDSSQPDMEAMLKKTMIIVQKFNDTFSLVKSVADTAKFVLAVYGGTVLVEKAPHLGATLLLNSPS